MMKFVVLVLFFGLTAGAKTYSQSEVSAMARASSETIERLSSQLHSLKSGGATSTQNSAAPIAFHCAPEPETCVVRCNSRYLDGSCASYGPDFCGPGASCTINCTSRYLDGSCASYGADICN